MAETPRPGQDDSDLQVEAAAGRESGLQRTLSRAQVVMIALGGAIGTGLFAGSSLAIGYAGPAVLISYLIAGFVALVALLRSLITGGDSNRASLVATGVIAIVFEPLRRRVQRGALLPAQGDHAQRGPQRLQRGEAARGAQRVEGHRRHHGRHRAEEVLDHGL
jgi:hypothetical protein